MTAQPPAVILGGAYNAVSVARSLSRAGVEVFALGTGMSSVRRSRHCARFADLGAGADVQARWLDWLQRDPLGAVLLPCDDDGLELIARNRGALVESGYLPFEVDGEVALAMLDKDHTYEIARRIGVAAPKTLTVRGEDDLETAIDTIDYPCALKPVHSHRFAYRYGRSLKAIRVENRDQLVAEFGRLIPLGIEMLVTEIVAGPEDSFYGYYSYLDDGGEPLFHLTKRKLRQCPPVFGVGSYHVTGWDPEVAEVGLRFLQGAGVRGLANVELKRDAHDGQLKLIECNHRFTAINELLRIAGADLALFAYRRTAGRESPPIRSMREGVRLWLPLKDARSARRMRRSGELTFPAWIRSIAHRQHTPLFEWRDPGPSVASTIGQAKRLYARLSPASEPEPVQEWP